MEDNKALIEEKEEEQVVGGTDATSPLKPMTMFCPACMSLDVKAKTFTIDKDNKYKVVYQCNSCGYVWESYPKPFGSGIDPMLK